VARELVNAKSWQQLVRVMLRQEPKPGWVEFRLLFELVEPLIGLHHAVRHVARRGAADRNITGARLSLFKEFLTAATTIAGQECDCQSPPSDQRRSQGQWGSDRPAPVVATGGSGKGRIIYCPRPQGD